MSSPTPDSAESSPVSVSLRTWNVFVLAVLLSAALAWINNEFVMTSEFYRDLLKERLGDSSVDRQIESFVTVRSWSYLAIPVLVWTRIALITLVVQMFCLLGMVDIPFRQLFRVVAIAFVATLAESLNRLVWIARQDVVDVSVLSASPGSLAAIALAHSASDSWSYVLLSQVSVFHLAWAALMVVGLMSTQRIGVAGAVAVTGGAWGLVTGLRVSLALYLQHLQG